MAESQDTISLFDQIGGEAAIARLVDMFYQQMDTLPAAAGIRAMHSGDLAPINEVLRIYLAEWLGGPKLYSASRGHPRLRMRHLPFKIGKPERDAWMMCMTTALDETIGDESIRKEIHTALGKLADWMQNLPQTPAS